MDDFTAIQQAIIEGDDEKTVKLVQDALKHEVSPADIVTYALQAGMATVGRKFSEGEFFIPEMLFAARSVTRAMDALRPRLGKAEKLTLGRVAIGTVAGDIHDIGKNLVGMFLEGAGFEIIDLGTDVHAEQFVEAVIKYKPDILGLSALLTTTMPAISATIAALEMAELRNKVKVIIGGAPVNQRFADMVKADGYGHDGGASIALCRKLLGK
jgi:5-methyltetrahydrofolate--homocysteine methyltransferase